MNARTEVEKIAGEGPAATAARDGDQDRSRPTPNPSHVAAATMPVTEGEFDRLSIDPLRATDRYRLVAPLPLRL